MQPRELCAQVVRSLDRHKAAEIRVLHVTELTSLADYFVIAEGTSSTQVKALTDYVEEELAEQGVTPLRTEGYQSSQWILQDYGTVIVHVFQKDTRAFYDLELLWKDGEELAAADFLESESDQK